MADCVISFHIQNDGSRYRAVISANDRDFALLYCKQARDLAKQIKEESASPC